MTQRQLLAVIATLLCAARAWAQPQPETGDPGNLQSLEALLDESVVTTASRSAERASTAPSAMFTITAEDIRMFGIRSVDEALGFLGVGMRVEKVRDYNSGIDVGARGLMLRDTGRHLLVLLDGHVMNSQANGEITLHEGLGVPLEAIDHIEVMLGAGSVMYGSNAMTAVVHVITKNAEREHGFHALGELSLSPPNDVDGDATRVGPRDHAGYHYRLGLGGAADFTLFQLPGSFSLRGEWQQNQSQSYRVDPVTGEGQLRAGETAWGGVAHHHMQTGSLVAALRLGDFTLRAQGTYYERSMPLVSVFNDPNSLEQREAVRLDLSHVKQLSRQLGLTSRIYFDFMRNAERTFWTREYWCAPGQIDGCVFDARAASRWFGLEQQLRFEPSADGTLFTSFGYDVRIRDGSGRPADYYDAITGANPSGVWLPYFHEQSVLGALFVQQLWSPWPWLTLNLGARLDMDSLFGARLSPRLAVVVTASDQTSFRASYSEAFRGPTPMELYASDPTYIVSPANLEPEIVRTAELEWLQRIGVVSLTLRPWLAFYQDFIVPRTATAADAARGFETGELARTVDARYAIVNANIDEIGAFGGTLVLQARPATGLLLAAAVTASRSRSPQLTESLWPHLFGNVRAAYEFAPQGASLALAGTFAVGRDAFNSYADNPLTAPRISARGALDLRLTLATPVPVVPGLHVRASAGVRVLPNTPYVVAGPSESNPNLRLQFDHSQPQLHLLLGVSYDL